MVIYRVIVLLGVDAIYIYYFIFNLYFFFNAGDWYDHDEVNAGINVANIKETLNLIEYFVTFHIK
jgi:hypothetical protein